MWHRFIVWWRGWDESDLLSAQAKIDNKSAPGAVITLTGREAASLPEIFRRDKIKKEYEMLTTILMCK